MKQVSSEFFQMATKFFSKANTPLKVITASHSSFKFFCNYLILKGLSKMLSFKKINNFNMLHKFQEKT